MISSESSSLLFGIDDGDEDDAAVSLFETIVIECERDFVFVVEFF